MSWLSDATNIIIALATSISAYLGWTAYREINRSRRPKGIAISATRSDEFNDCYFISIMVTNSSSEFYTIDNLRVSSPKSAKLLPIIQIGANEEKPWEPTRPGIDRGAISSATNTFTVSQRLDPDSVNSAAYGNAKQSAYRSEFALLLSESKPSKTATIVASLSSREFDQRRIEIPITVRLTQEIATQTH